MYRKGYIQISTDDVYSFLKNLECAFNFGTHIYLLNKNTSSKYFLYNFNLSNTYNNFVDLESR